MLGLCGWQCHHLGRHGRAGLIGAPDAYARSVYLPSHFTASQTADVAAFVAAATADPVTFDGVKPVASLIPVIWDQDTGEHGRLLGHLALANPQWQSVAPGSSALADRDAEAEAVAEQVIVYGTVAGPPAASWRSDVSRSRSAW